MAEQTNNSPVFLITGCSTGLGRELALAALASGFHVIATARRPDTLSDLEARGAKALALDVTASTQELADSAAKAIVIYGQVDYLVNNAGYAQGGCIEEVSPAEALNQFNTNFFGLVNTTNAFLPYFRARRAGTLVNISSQVTSGGAPGTGMYSASKAAIDAVSDTWANELAEYGIRSICVKPGAFRTEFFKQAVAHLPANTIDGYEVLRGTLQAMMKKYGNAVPGDPAKCARNIIKVATRPQIPLRFAIGDDAVPNLKAFYQKRLEELEAFRDLNTGTNFDA
ncbi:dehydrogenase [Mycena galericulata]|nr:dehydrogenase [Mycena galericulata]